MEVAEDILSEIKPFVGGSGTCSDEKALAAINKARRLLWNKRDWENTLDWICIQCAEKCVVLPSAYKQIRFVFMGNSPMRLQDEWWQKFPEVGLCNSNCAPGQDFFYESGGYHVTFREYHTAPYRIRLIAEDGADAGKELTFWCIDEYGTRKTVKITLGNTFVPVDSIERIKYIKQVAKPATEGRVRVMAFNPDLNEYLLLAIYQPEDINPKFRKFKSNRASSKATIQVKKRFFEIGMDGLVEFTTEAIQFAAMANGYKSARDNNKYVENLDLAVREQNKEEADNEVRQAGTMKFAGWRTQDPLVAPFDAP